MSGELFKPDPGDPGNHGVDIDLVIMAMELTQSPVLVRRDPVGSWWVIAQGPPGVLHCHVIDPFYSLVRNFPSPFDCALDLAHAHTLGWKAKLARESGATDDADAFAAAFAAFIARELGGGL